MGGNSSKPSSIGSSILGGISDVSGKVGEIASNPYVQRVGQIASIGATLSGHPEIGAGISGGLTGAREIAPIVSDITGELSGQRNKQSNNNNVYYPTRYQTMTATNNPEFNRRIGDMEMRRRRREANRGLELFSNPTINAPLGSDRSTWSPTQHRR
jgi:hypothetical protein